MVFEYNTLYTLFIFRTTNVVFDSIKYKLNEIIFFFFCYFQSYDQCNYETEYAVLCRTWKKINKTKMKNFLPDDRVEGGGESVATAASQEQQFCEENERLPIWVTGSPVETARDETTARRPATPLQQQHPVPTRLLPLAKRARGSVGIPRSWSPSP